MSDLHVPTLGHPDPAGESLVIDDTQTHTGDWNQLVVVEAAVIATVTMPLTENSAGYVGATLAAGTKINQAITSISLTSGTVKMSHLVQE